MHLYSIAILFAAHAHNVSSPNAHVRLLVTVDKCSLYFIHAKVSARNWAALSLRASC